MEDLKSGCKMCHMQPPANRGLTAAVGVGMKIVFVCVELIKSTVAGGLGAALYDEVQNGTLIAIEVSSRHFQYFVNVNILEVCKAVDCFGGVLL